MTMNSYTPDALREPVDAMILVQAGDEPLFDPPLRDFLLTSHRELKERLMPTSLVEAASLGRNVPWLYRLTFSTRGLAREGDGEVQETDRHTIALRFLPDFLRRADKFELCNYVEPRRPPPFHPNICPRTGAICLEIYAGEPLIQIVASLHDLLRWRIRQLSEHDALNPIACNYGRNFVPKPIDDRPLFGRRWHVELEPLEAVP